MSASRNPVPLITTDRLSDPPPLITMHSSQESPAALANREAVEPRPPRVSIGLPVYNGERFIVETLDSILEQTYSDFELIISDNGSTDRTQEICLAYAAQDSRIRYYRSEINRGATKNFNLVFALATGEYFKWAADDDTIAPEFIERCVEVLDSDPDIVVAYPKTLCINEESAVIHDYDSILTHGQWADTPTGRFRQVLEEFKFNGGASANVYNFGLIRTSMLEKTSLLGKHLMADLNLVSEMSLHGNFYEIPEHLMFIRAHPGSSSWFEGADWSIAEWQEFFDPTVTGKFALSWSLRKHHLEYARAVLRSPLGARDKASLLLYCTRTPFKLIEKKVTRLFVSPLRS